MNAVQSIFTFLAIRVSREKNPFVVKKQRFLGMCLLAGVLVSCTPPDESPGQNPVPDQAAAWHVEPLSKATFAPGEAFKLLVRQVDLDLDAVFLWFEGESFIKPFLKQVVQAGPEPTYEDDLLAFYFYVPTIQTGSFTIALGSETKQYTVDLAIKVQIPGRLMPQAEAASLLGDGLIAMLNHVQDLLNFEDLSYQTYTKAYLGDHVATLNTIFQDLSTLKEELETSYMQIPEKEEQAFQIMLSNMGIMSYLTAFSDFSNPSLLIPQGTITLFDQLNHKTHRVLYELDILSMTLNIAGDVLSYADALLFLGGVTAELGAVGMTLSLTITLTKAIIETFIPTDLVQLEGHDQVEVIQSTSSLETRKWLYWGTFQAEYGPGAALQASLENLVAEVISTQIPTHADDAIVKKVAIPLINKLLTKLPRLTEAYEDLKGLAPKEVKTLVNMSVYSLTLGDLLQLVPYLGPLTNIITSLVDWEVIPALSVGKISPDWASGADLSFDYGNDLIAIKGIDFPAGQSEAYIEVKAHAYHWTTWDVWVANLPWVKHTDFVHKPLKVRKERQLSSENDTPDTQTYLITKVEAFTDKKGVKHEAIDEWVMGTSTTERAISFEFKELFINNSLDSTMQVRVNDQIQLDNISLSDTSFAPYLLKLQAGFNLITITALKASGQGFYKANPFRVEVHIPEASNQDKSKGIFLEEGQSYTLYVWTPPELD